MFKNLSPEALGISDCEGGIIELALSHGFKSLDLDLAAFAEQVKTQGLARASRLIVSARLKIGSFRLPVRWEEDSPNYQADLARLPALAEMAVQLGCTRATTLILPGSDTRPYHENFEFHRRRLAEIAEVLRPFKIRLGVGFLAPIRCRAGMAFQFIQTFDEALLLLRTIGPPNVGLAFDTWHWYVSGGKLETLRALAAEKIVTVSLADADAPLAAADAELASRRLPGLDSVIDIPAVLLTLAEMGYVGPVSPAPDKSQFGALSRDKVVKNAGAALDWAWKTAGLNLAGRLVAVTGR